MKVNWRIYYDGVTPKGYSVYSNLDGPWEDAYPHGVVCVAVRDTTKIWGRFIASGFSPIRKERGNPDSLRRSEIFVKYPDDDEPFATNCLEPFKDRMANHFAIIDIELYTKYGREVNQLKWQEIMNQAVKDPDFPIGTPRRRAKDG